MSTTIKITNCDNEILLIAYPAAAPTKSYTLAHVKSGNSNSVSVTATISAGTYAAPQIQDGVNGPLNKTYDVNLPAGSYKLITAGINWGGPANFTFTVNNGSPQNYSAASGDGVAWTPSLTDLTIS